MTEYPRQQRAIETRNQILKAGLELFSKDGYHQTSSKKIAAAAGVATGTFYNHFADKKALLLALHAQHVDQVHLEIENFFIHHPRDEKFSSYQMMRDMVDLIFRTHQFGPELHRELNILSQTDPDFEKMAARERERGHAKLSEAIAPHAHLLRVKDTEAANIVLGMAIETVVHAIAMEKNPIDKERLLDALTDMLHRFLFADA